MTGEPKSGQVASLFSTTGSSTLASGEAMTRLGSTTFIYINNRTSPTDHSWWDPYHVPVIKKDGVAIASSLIANIYYAAGMVELVTWASGTYTCDVYWCAPSALGGVYGFSFEPKADTQDITVFPTTLNSPVVWKSYIKTLMDWTGTAQRHFFYGRAWTLMDCTLAHSDLIWSEKSWGVPGNLRKVVYVVSGSNTVLEVAYNAGTHTYTVTVGTGSGGAATSTAAAIKAHVEADPVLNALVSVDYPEGETGTGIVNAVSVQTMTGGRDQNTDFNKIGTMVLIRAYLNITTGSLEMISGLCHLVGLPMNMKLEALYESDLTLQGIGPLLYHTI